MMVQILAYEALGCWVISTAISDELPGEPERLRGWRSSTVPAAARGEAYVDMVSRVAEALMDQAYR